MATLVEPITEAQTWLLERLSAEPGVAAVFGTRIWHSPAERGEPFPVLVFDYLLRGKAVKVIEGIVLYYELPFVVKGIIDRFDQTVIAPGVVAARNALHKQRELRANSEILACLCEKPITYPETTESRQFLHLGFEATVHIRVFDT